MKLLMTAMLLFLLIPSRAFSQTYPEQITADDAFEEMNNAEDYATMLKVDAAVASAPLCDLYQEALDKYEEWKDVMQSEGQQGIQNALDEASADITAGEALRTSANSKHDAGMAFVGQGWSWYALDTPAGYTEAAGRWNSGRQQFAESQPIYSQSITKLQDAGESLEEWIETMQEDIDAVQMCP